MGELAFPGYTQVTLWGPLAHLNRLHRGLLASTEPPPGEELRLRERERERERTPPRGVSDSRVPLTLSLQECQKDLGFPTDHSLHRLLQGGTGPSRLTGVTSKCLSKWVLNADTPQKEQAAGLGRAIKPSTGLGCWLSPGSSKQDPGEF